MPKPMQDNREPMSKVDTAWLRMESPTNLMMITSVLVFTQPLELAKLRQLLEQRFLAFRRFRQKAVDTILERLEAHKRPINEEWNFSLQAMLDEMRRLGGGRESSAGAEIETDERCTEQGCPIDWASKRKRGEEMDSARGVEGEAEEERQKLGCVQRI